MRIRLILAITALLLGCTNALAQVSCNARACSQALRGCYDKCPVKNSDECRTHCPREFQHCMRTGDFEGKFCQKHGLIRE
jgi:hypothetical protein